MTFAAPGEDATPPRPPAVLSGDPVPTTPWPPLAAVVDAGAAAGGAALGLGDPPAHAPVGERPTAAAGSFLLVLLLSLPDGIGLSLLCGSWQLVQ